MERSDIDIRTALRLIYFSSFASLSYEMALMRVFSITLWYHFAFMVISIAMLGIGASGTALFVFPGLKKLRRIPFFALVLAITIPASYLLANAVPFDPARLSWDRTQILAVSLYYVILCMPFVCFGLIVSTAYAALSLDAARVYSADLLGAGAGALGMAWLLSLGGPETTIFTVSALLATGLLYEKNRIVRINALLLAVVNLAVLLLQPPLIQPRISPYKPFALAMQFPGAKLLGTAYSASSRIDLFESPAVRFAPGLSFTYLAPLPEQVGMAIDAGDIFAITDETDRSKLSFIRSLPSSLAYRLSRNKDVLIVEPRSGLALLTARQFRAQNVLAIDSNPLVLRVLREFGRMHGSPVYMHHAWEGLARTWLSNSPRQFDLIDLSFMGSYASAAFGFAEDYRFTVEAFEQYLSHLKPEGFLSLNLYIIPPPRTELRLLATLIRSARAEGIGGISQHIAAIRSWGTLTMVVKKSALTPDDINRIKAFVQEMRFDLVYYPGIKPEESNVRIRMPNNEYAETFGKLLDRNTRGRFMNDYPFDIRPVTDERPFFHYYLKLENIKTIYRVVGGKWQYFIEEGYLLPILFLQVFIVSAILILLPLITLKKNEIILTKKVQTLRALSYFGLLGLAYLFVEIAFIQKMILCLENPSYAASTVIASVLISSGIGSLLSTRLGALEKPHILLVLAGIVLCSGLLFPPITRVITLFPLGERIILSSLLVVPAGILMGIPFPLGISTLGSSAPRLIPWAWAVNGCFSVLAPVLATMLALSTGFRFVLFSGAAMYCAAYWIIRRN